MPSSPAETPSSEASSGSTVSAEEQQSQESPSEPSRPEYSLSFFQEALNNSSQFDVLLRVYSEDYKGQYQRTTETERRDHATALIRFVNPITVVFRPRTIVSDPSPASQMHDGSSIQFEREMYVGEDMRRAINAEIIKDMRQRDLTHFPTLWEDTQLNLHETATWSYDLFTNAFKSAITSNPTALQEQVPFEGSVFLDEIGDTPQSSQEEQAPSAEVPAPSPNIQIHTQRSERSGWVDTSASTDVVNIITNERVDDRTAIASFGWIDRTAYLAAGGERTA